jgi:hypothetical protein
LKPGGVCVTHEPGSGHAASAAAIELVRTYGVTEKDMNTRKVIALGREAGFERFYVFPLPQDNRLTEYRMDDAFRVFGDGDGTRVGPGNPVDDAWWLKKLFHAVVRRRFGFSPAGYSAFLANLWQLREVCEKTDWDVLSMHCGLVVLVK